MFRKIVDRIDGKEPIPDFNSKEEYLAWKQENGHAGPNSANQSVGATKGAGEKASLRRNKGSEWVAIDFETANESRGSACAVGLAIVRNGVVARSWSQLISPPEMRFNPINIKIHGIRPEMVRGMPTFGEYWPMLGPVLHGKIVVAHNASFDMSVLRSMMDRYEIPHPPMEYFCTVALAKKLWPDLKNHKLNTVSSHLRIPLNHHEAEADAVACAELTVRGCQALGVKKIDVLGGKLGVKSRKLGSK